jgi:hypothetical protein
VFVNACSELLPKNLNDLIEDTGWDGDVLLDPWDVFNDWDLDGGDIVVAKATLLSLSPS